MNASVATFELTSPRAPKPRPRRGGWAWGPVEAAKLRVLSMGAGVQTTALLFMALAGEIGPRPDAMIFADTGDEIDATMKHLAFCEGEVARLTNGQMASYRVERGGRLSDRVRIRSEGRETRIANDRFVSAPFFVNGKESVGQGRRQCTREFKVEPLEKMQRQLLGYKPRARIPKGSVEVWIGISTDEVVRAGAAYSPWVVNRYPLLEKGMSRSDCERWLARNGLPVPPKSACFFCPYKTNREWRWLRDNDPDAWAAAIEIDGLVRNTPGMKSQEFLHRACRPLVEVDLSTDEERGQGMLDICDGGCGL